MTTPTDNRIPSSMLGVMLVTDRKLVAGSLAGAVECAVMGGVTAVQLREPDLGAADLLVLALELLDPIHRHGAVLLVNDRIDVARAAGADGVHLRRSSLSPEEARRQLGAGALIGVSTHTEKEVEQAFAGGADYVVFGPVFPTPSKEGILNVRGPERYLALAASAAGPVLALGGIAPETIDRMGEVRRADTCSFRGPLRVAAIRSLLAAGDPLQAARALSAALKRAERGRRVR